MLAPAVLLSLLCLPGCTPPPPPPLTHFQVPAPLLQCLPQPEPPAQLTTDADLANYMLDLANAGQDCRDALGRIKEMLAP